MRRAVKQGHHHHHHHHHHHRHHHHHHHHYHRHSHQHHHCISIASIWDQLCHHHHHLLHDDCHLSQYHHHHLDQHHHDPFYVLTPLLWDLKKKYMTKDVTELACSGSRSTRWSRTSRSVRWSLRGSAGMFKVNWCLHICICVWVCVCICICICVCICPPDYMSFSAPFSSRWGGGERRRRRKRGEASEAGNWRRGGSLSSQSALHCHYYHGHCNQHDHQSNQTSTQSITLSNHLHN